MKIDLRDLEDKGENDPALDDFKHCIKKFAESAKKLSNSSEGKKLSSNKWSEIVNLIKKSKIAVSMIELGIDDEEEFSGNNKDSNDMQNTKGQDGEADAQNNKDSNVSGQNNTSKELAALGLKKEEKQLQSTKSIKEKSTSKSQQRLFGMVHAYNNGDLKNGDVDEDLMKQIKKISKGMSKKDAKKMAKTKHTDLPEKVPTREYYDTLNHFSILLSEQKFDKFNSDGSSFFVENFNRKFTIEFNEKFYLVSENYNFELGDDSDLQQVVNTFKKLIHHSDHVLIREYESMM